ncbi:MAG TPA: lysylphosphatidylglycerol synthase transmembrane domain-containing protein [Xanthobacteraceae bacterium]|nr:lysylphosphatidylglycerol synthase transmembrane domain-containing protein [Xanthobacteraceae bacterium]
MRRMKLASTILLLIGVVAIVLWSVEPSAIVDSVRRVSWGSLGIILAALFANVLAASLRVKLMAGDIGHRLSFAQAMAAVGVGGLAGAAFFQLAGQLIGRGYVMARSNGMPFAAVTVVTLYERVVAALVSALFALAGAYFIFGQVYLNKNAGGDELIKIVCGLFAVAIAGAAAGYGRRAIEVIAPYLTRAFVWRILRAMVLSVMVQLPVMAAYIVAAQTLSPHTLVADLAAASAIVMFAASVPISLAGWGVREMSAILALGAIGVGVAEAMLAAVIVGVGSLLTMVILAVVSLHTWIAATPSPQSRPSGASAVDYETVLVWCLPIAAAMLVLFQLYVPLASGTLLNVNLADPLAILGGALFVLKAVRTHSLPYWRFSHFYVAVAATTAVLTFSLLLGAVRFGWTEWAVVNRFLGWFVLLSYLATASLIVRQEGESAFRMLLLTYAAASAAVAALEVGLVILYRFGIRQLPVIPHAIEAFAQNRNSFALQLLMAVAAAMVAECGKVQRITLFSLLMVGILFSGSRSGWIALAFLVAASLYVRAARVQVIAAAVASGAICVVGVWLAETAAQGATGHLFPPVLSTASSTQERIVTLLGGWRMFLEHPILGAGLGAFRNGQILSSRLLKKSRD